MPALANCSTAPSAENKADVFLCGLDEAGRGPLAGPVVAHTLIDEINILEASLLAMKKAYEALSEKFDVWLKAAALSGGTICAVADGTFCPDIGCECRSEVKADAKYANKVPALTSISKEDRIKALQGYKDGSNNAFGMGKVMQLHAKNLSDEDMAAVSEYIESLK